MSTNIIKIIQKSLLKTILAYVACNKDVCSSLALLSKISHVSMNGHAKSSKKACYKCKRPFDNILLLIFHLELFHNDSLSIVSYQFQKDALTISTKQYGSNYHQFFLSQGKDTTLLFKLEQRTKSIVNAIFTKFSVKKHKSERQYYSAIDIFSKITEQSQQNQEDDIGSIERELQKMKINEFSDVSQNEKQFFLTWNDFMSKEKRMKGINFLDNDTMGQIIQQYSRICKDMGIQRNNLLMHLWTLWSAGKIPAEQISICLNIYDQSDQGKK